MDDDWRIRRRAVAGIRSSIEDLSRGPDSSSTPFFVAPQTWHPLDLEPSTRNVDGPRVGSENRRRPVGGADLGRTTNTGICRRQPMKPMLASPLTATGWLMYLIQRANRRCISTASRNLGVLS